MRVFAARGIIPRRVSDRPEEWRAGPLTLRVDRQRDRVALRYARSPVGGRVACDADAVIRAHQRILAKLRAESLAPDVLFDVLAEAYRSLLDRAGARSGERVKLSDLVPEVARLARDRRGTSAAYTRAQFAYDLARLREERGVARAGQRIDLGVATGGATTRKSKVIWIENPSGGGHYYASFRIVPQPTSEAEGAHADEA